MDLALPDNLLVAELLPHLLRHAGQTGDDRAGGWLLRRATGAVLDPGHTLLGQGVRDGELLHLTPARDDWPEPAYDDVAEVVADSTRSAGRTWDGRATRRCGLAAGATALGLGAVGLLLAGPPWPVPATAALVVAALLVGLGTLVTQAFTAPAAGALTASAALPYAFVGGAAIVAPAGQGPTALGAPGVLLGSATMLAFSVVGLTLLGTLRRLFVAGLVTGLAGLLAAALCLVGTSPAGAAAVALTAVTGLLPGYPLVAVWSARLPVPDLAGQTASMLAARPVPTRDEVSPAVARATELLTGLLLATAVAGVPVAAFLLLADRSVAARLLVASAAAAMLLRARLFPVPGQRIPLLAGGAATAVVLAVGAASGLGPGWPRLLLAVAVVAVGAAVLVVTLLPRPSGWPPRLGRAADLLDVVAIMALIPLACAVVGIFGTIQALFASVG
jgi:type VII secretion integral membrane protein EccD